MVLRPPSRHNQEAGTATYPSLLVIGLGAAGVEASLALAKAGHCSLTLADDTLATAKWRSTVTYLSRASTRGEDDGETTSTFTKKSRPTRSRTMAPILNVLGKRPVGVLSPIGNASIVERFDAVILVDPSMPKALAFNEHCRAVGCGFLMVESRGPVGRLFRDFGSSSRSLREALLGPRFSPIPNDTTCVQDSSPQITKRTGVHKVVNDEETREAKTYGSPRAAGRWTNGEPGLATEDLSQGKKGKMAESLMHWASVELSPKLDRRLQLHACFQALHVFQQEHGHPPLMYGRDHAEEVVRLAEEFVENDRNVPRDFACGIEKLDKLLCRKMSALARASIPAVDFVLGGLAASEVRHWANSRRQKARQTGRGITDNGSESVDGCLQRASNGRQWFLVDEMDTAYDSRFCEQNMTDEGYLVEDTGVYEDLYPLEAWLGNATAMRVKGARIALVGCNRLGRDVARCLALSGACTSDRGRVVFIDSSDALQTGTENSALWSSRRGISYPMKNSENIPGRASVLRELISGTGPGLFPQTSAFDGSVQETDEDADLWEGVDAVVMCVSPASGSGGARRMDFARDSSAVGETEEAVRFVSHKCVLHKNPLVRGWAGGEWDGDAGVETMAPGRTRCLICSNHGEIKGLVDRRNKPSPTEGDASEDQYAADGATAHHESTRQEAPRANFGMVRSTIAGLVVMELFKLLAEPHTRTSLRNWIFVGDSTPEKSGCARTAGYIRPIRSTPDPPLAVLSTAFDPFSGDSVRAVPEGFTEWDIEEIQPWAKQSRTRNADSVATAGVRVGRTLKKSPEAADDPGTLQTLSNIILARFGVEVKSVAAAALGSECRGLAGGGAGGCGGLPRSARLLWAEWEKKETVAAPFNRIQRASPLSKMDQTVAQLWKKAMRKPPMDGLPALARSEQVGKEPRFVFLDIRGRIGREDVVLPVFKYWVR